MEIGGWNFRNVPFLDGGGDTAEEGGGRNLIGTLPFPVANVIGTVIPRITAEKILFIYSTIYLY